MDPLHYQSIKIFLETATYHSQFTKTQKEQLQRKSQYFCIKNNQLYKRKQKQNQDLLKVIQKHEVEAVLYLMHNHPLGAHFGIDKMFDKIKSRYYWPQMYEHIRNYVKTCDSCQKRGKYRQHGSLHPIKVEAPFDKIGIDFVGPLPSTAQENKYIIVAMDYMTKYPEAKAVPNATAQQTADFIYKDIICRHGCSNFILSDRGTHFNNLLIEGLMQKFQIKHLLTTPYHLQTNGLVERFNRTLCESLAKLANDNTEWDKLIPSVLFSYRSSKHATTKFTPFLLTYGREPKLPIFGFQENSEQNLLTRLYSLIEDLPANRAQAKKNVEKSQQRQKFYWDRKLKKVKRLFEKEEQVLCYDAAGDKHFTGKLLLKWKGPYFIYSKVAQDVYKLRTMDGQILETPINAYLLKKYYNRQAWDPMIII